ncbi:MAG: AAA family ATPase [Alistipes sp.]|nr:AAA family ATPase [Candidatus Alistipes equi]
MLFGTKKKPRIKNSEGKSIELDENNKEFKNALDLVLNTNESLYLTGKAGSGKTTFLHFLRTMTRKQTVVLAPTGIASVNAQGQTIHSFFHIAPSIYSPDEKRMRFDTKDEKKAFFKAFPQRKDKIEMFKKLETIIIDEVSMVRCDLMDVVDTILRVYRRKNSPFGGVQMVFIGDMFQLPPVVTSNESEILRANYPTEFFFSSRAVSKLNLRYIELKKIYRQKDNDFIDILNNIRYGMVLREDIAKLNQRVNPLADGKKNNAIFLTATNREAQKINQERLDAIQEKEYTFKASIDGNVMENEYPTDETLKLKCGAQVILLRNHFEQGYFNGKSGVFVGVERDEDGEEFLLVDITDNHFGKRTVYVSRDVWQKTQYILSEEGTITEKSVGSFTQFPIKLAWAITIHKSQGMTFDNIIVDAGYAFAAGQIYVALSRCTSLEGIELLRPLNSRAVICDSRIISYTSTETPTAEIEETLNESTKSKCN